MLIGAGQASGELTKIYEEYFTEYPVGTPLNGQGGWSALPNHVFVAGYPNNEDPFQIIGSATSRGPITGFETMAVTPQFATVPPNSGLDYVTTMRLAFDSTRTSWYITLRNVSQKTIVSRVAFEAGGTISVLVPDGQGGGGFVPVEGVSWRADRLVLVTMVNDDNGVFRLAINGREVADVEAPAFAVGVEQISFECGNERVGDTMYFDRIISREGNVSR